MDYHPSLLGHGENKMPRQAKGLSAAKVSKGRPGRYGDGDGLYLEIRSKTSAFYSFRYVRAGRMREIGLGPARGRRAVSLTDARAKAREFWDIHKSGRDPLAERKAGRAAIIAASIGKGRAFVDAANDYIEAYRSSWRNSASERQWTQSLEDYVYPVIGGMSVADIGTAHVVAVLQPLWTVKPETASRIRGRIEQVLDREKVLSHRGGENPARWRGHLSLVLPRHGKIRTVKHHAAMPAKEVGDFMAHLRADDDRIARALEFTIITCARTAEVLGAHWDEINLDDRLWTVPASRMKAGRESRLPLSTRAIEILKEMQKRRTGEFVFPGRLKGKPLSAMTLYVKLKQMKCPYTTHGFRSTFRDWVSDSTNFKSEIAELALAHNVGGDVERAYRRGDALEKRYQLAEKWAEFCARPSIKDGKKVVSMRALK
jgi:integrase